MTLRLMKRSPLSITEVYDLIVQYCDDRTEGIGGYWGQEPYKADFFNIFFNAYYNGHVGGQAWRKLRNASKRKRGLKTADYVVTGTTIKDYLKSNWKPGKAHVRDAKQMAEELLTWWDVWTYAWDKYPNPIPRRYFRRPESTPTPVRTS
jgi:hypothetical protein